MFNPYCAQTVPRYGGKHKISDFKTIQVKDKLKYILRLFNPSEYEEFQYYLRKHKQSGKLLISELANLLRTEDVSPELLMQQLEVSSKPAYDAVRRDLHGKIREFIAVLHYRSSTTFAATQEQEIQLIKYLVAHSEFELAKFYLEKLEEKAENSSNYLLLEQANLIRQEITRNPDELFELTEKWARIHEFAELERKFSIAKTELKAQVEIARLNGKLVDFKTQAKRIAIKYQFTEIVFQHPKFFLELIMLSRMAATASKNYHEFLNFLLPRFERIMEETDWKQYEQHIQPSLNYIMAHALYRNHKFKRAEEIINNCIPEIKELDLEYRNKLLVKSILLKAAIYAYDNRIELAIHTIQQEIQTEDCSEIERYNVKLNLIVYLFFAQRFNECHFILNEILENRKEVVTKMGKEWVLKVELIELTLLYELTLFDLIENKVRNIERNYAEMLKQDAYSRVKVFTQSIRSIVKAGADIEREATYAKIAKGFEKTSGLDTDLQAIAFYCWVKSKIEHDTFYAVLMHMLNSTFAYLKTESDQLR